MASFGVCKIIRYLAQRRMIDAIVTTVGNIEEDLIKCIDHTYLGDFTLRGDDLHDRTLNRIGNLILPNSHHVKLDSWMALIISQMLTEQDAVSMH